MTADRPQAFFWDGEAMRPRSPRLADKAYCIGEVYWLVPHEERSTATHNHEFAWLKDAWLNLPEDMADQCPTQEHLRKRALIDAGFYNETVTDAGSNAAALRVAATMRAMDEFALVIVRGPLVVLRRAKSQSRRAMGKQEFQESKTAIIETISAMICVTPGQLLSTSNSADSAPTSRQPDKAAGNFRPHRTPAANHSHESSAGRASGDSADGATTLGNAPSALMATEGAA
jgi:hypothetical protein